VHIKSCRERSTEIGAGWCADRGE
jgi:hypothetical protein